MIKIAHRVSRSLSKHILGPLLYATLIGSSLPAHAQYYVTMAPDADLTLAQPAIASPTAVGLKNVTTQTRTVKLKRTFLEDFSNFKLSENDQSTTGWKTHFANINNTHWMGRTLPGNNEQQIYVDPNFPGATTKALGLNPFAVYNKTLSISANRIPAWYSKNLTFPVDSGPSKTFQYTSGLLTTYNTFSQTYGYFEFKATLPRDNAAWAGMWMLPNSKKWPPEIDVMEVHNQPGRPANQAMTVAHGIQNGVATKSYCYVQLEPGAHIYGVLWTAETMTYYEDRKPICSFPTPPGLNEPMYLLLQLAVGPEVTASSPTQMQMRVNWVAAYKIQ